MCESVKLARMLDVSGTLLNTTCRQNSAIVSLTTMAKIRLSEKAEPKTSLLQPEHGNENRNPYTAVKMSSSLESSSSYSSSLESDEPNPHEGSYMNEVISGVRNIRIFKNDDEGKTTEETRNDDEVEEDEEVTEEEETEEEVEEVEVEEESVDGNENDEGLIERGPVRPQLHPMNRSRPYVESHHWLGSGPPQQPENSTDYDTSAKEILTDREYREKIDFCLDKLSDMSQERSMTNSLSPAYSDFGGTSGYSQPPQQQQWSPTGSRSSVPSITVCDSESSLLEILSRGGFQAAQASQTPEYNSAGSVASQACASDNWPDSPASSYNACATSASRPDSRASSRAQSPGSNNGCGGTTFLNLLGSPMGSPQVSPQNFRNLQRPSSSSSSSQSYCDTPSPANYQNPLDQHLEEQLGDHIMNRLPAWRDSYESSDTLVNSVDSSELQLQLVEEVIRGDMNNHQTKARNDMQVVPNCRNIPNYGTSIDNGEANDELTNTLLRFVGSDQAVRKMENRCRSSYNGTEKICDGISLQPINNNVYESSRNHQTVYQHPCTSANTTANMESLYYSSAPMEMMGRNLWQNSSETNSMVGNPSSNNHFNEFQIPETVTSYNSQRSKRSTILNPLDNSSKCGIKNTGGGERTIAPWPSLNLPSTRASERLKEMTDPHEVEKAMKNLLKRPIDQLAKGDEDGDTMLMCLAGNPLELRKKLAYLAPLVERLGTIDGALSMLNSRGEDALYLAAMNCPQMAFVAGYLAAAFLQKNIDIGQRLYRSRGDTLIHALAAKGDAHGEVLAELLSLKTSHGNSVFDLSKRNYDGRTALHVAAESHDSTGRKTVAIGTTQLLLESGADPTIREVRCGDTALHLAVSLSCDPSLVKALLTGRGRDAVNIGNYNGNTPLHLAAVISDRTSLERQSKICWHLIHAGGRTNLTNRQGKTPLALASPDRKEALRRIFHKKT